MIQQDILSKKLGIIGGGQLGKMMVSETSKMGISTIVLDPNEECPAGCLADEKIIAGFDNQEALLKLAEKTDVLTCEFEHISIEALKFLESKGYKVYPKADHLEMIQNKYKQKMELLRNDIKIGDFLKVDEISDIKDAAKIFGYPIMLKTSLGAYDGKGNSLIKSEKEIENSFKELGGNGNSLYIEKFIPFVKEISVICCGGMNGEIKVYPVSENIHEDSILVQTSVPAELTMNQRKNAKDIAKKVYGVFGSLGILCVEMFLMENGDIFVNEVAPRPHNSGHYTIEGCMTSQFENHVRAVMGLPLGKTDLLMPTVMRNILGENGYQGASYVTGVNEVLSIEGLSLHIYGKRETKPKRKMGHMTIIAETMEEAKEKADNARDKIKIIAK